MSPRTGFLRGNPPRLLWGGMAFALALAGVARSGAADANEEVEAIYSRPSHGYQRTRLEDGSFRAETYTFEKGEFWGGEISDDSIDHLAYAEVIRTIAGPLAGQNYLPAHDPQAAQLRIVVSWGTTIAPEHRSMSMANQQLEDAQGRSPSMSDTIGGSMQDAELNGVANTDGGGGFRTSLNPGFDPGAAKTAQGRIVQAEVTAALRQTENDSAQWALAGAANAQMLGYPSMAAEELQRYRYFVVLQAYDNQTKAQGSKRKLLWESRISISEHRNRFDKRLASMVQNAAPYFGQDSQGLRHRDLPAGHVEIGEIRSLDDVTAATGAALAPDGSRVAYLRTERFRRRLVIVDLEHPGHLTFGDVPNLGAIPTEFAWSDDGHVGVTLSSNESYTFDAAGHRTDAWSPPVRARADPDVGKVLAAVAAKFPHRAVVVCGGDQAGDRFLLQISGGESPARYYVFDRANDVILDVGRASHSP